MNALPQHPLAVRTTCAYCGVGCGVLARPDGSGGAAISGDPEHPSNFGRLCSKGTALGETLGLDTRLLHPMLKGSDGAMARASWDEALTRTAQGFADIIDKHGPDSVAFYLSGQLLTEDYYVANKLMKGFIGSANVDTNSRLCMASSVAGHRRAFGSDTVPGAYADLDQADLIVLVGSNTAWCHPVLYQRIIANKRQRGARIVVIDPRRTPTVEDDDLHLAVAPGMDTALFSGLLSHLADNLAFDFAYLDAHTTGLTDALVRAREIAPDVASTAAACDLREDDVAGFFELFRTTAKVVTCYSQGVNQSAQGTDKVGAIINCHLATGRIGRPGMGPFSLTGQPNAMGGREVGGLANQLAAHMDFTPEAIDRVGRFWRAPNMAQREGRKAVALFDAIGRGEIRALWVMATNPLVSLPRAGVVREAMKQLDLLVISDNVAGTDTIALGADVLLPAAGWGEKDGTVTNSERRISRQRAFLPLPGEARPDWWIVAQVAQRMGFGHGFDYRSAAEIFREHAALSAFENGGSRDFDIGALATLSDDQFNALDPVQWPAPAGHPLVETRLFADGGYFTPDSKARLVAPELPSRSRPSASYPYRLNTGRVRDQWHTMTRTGLSPRLGAHIAAPFVEVHPADAADAGLSAGGFARITTEHGSCVVEVLISEGQRRGSLFAPIHWSDQTASTARIGELVAPTTDPFSGQPDAKATPAAIARAEFALRGFVLTRGGTLALPDGTWWSRAAIAGGAAMKLASDQPIAAWRQWAQASFADAELAEYCDEQQQRYRVAAIKDGRLIACLFLGAACEAPQWDAVKPLFESRDAIGAGQRRALLSGRPADGIVDPGPVVCACFGVGLNALRATIESGAATSVEAIGASLRAGTNCGSCQPELRKLIARHRGTVAA